MAKDANSAIRTLGHGVGLGHVGSYQSAGTPFLTCSFLRAELNSGSIVRIEFPRVAKSVTVRTIPNTYVVPGSAVSTSDPINIFFGQSLDSSDTSRTGENVFDVLTEQNAPNQYTQKHVYTLSYIASGSGGYELGEAQTFNIRSDHINLFTTGPRSTAAQVSLTGRYEATSSYQVYAELTNISADRMAADYISGSGVNTL